MNSKRMVSISVVFVLLLLGFASYPSHGMAAKKITINCISAWPKSLNTVEFWLKDFVERIQKEADQKYPGELKLIYKGGPEVVPTLEQITAVSKGMVDLMFSSVSYYLSILPELDMWNLSPFTPWEERAVGLYDYVDKLHNEKTNTHFLSHNLALAPFQFGLNKPVKTLDDFKGLSVRANPTTVTMLKALGANPVQMPAGDLYMAMERNVVQAYVMPAFVIRDFGVLKVTKYLLSPGFYNIGNQIVINLDKWNQLPKHLQELIVEQTEIHEHHMYNWLQELQKQEYEIFKAEGMQFIDLPPADADKFLKIAKDSLIKVSMGKAPDETKKILEFFSKKP